MRWAIAFLLCGVTSLQAQERPVLMSPEVRGDRTVVFRLWAPSANEAAPMPWEPQRRPAGVLHHEEFVSARQQVSRRFVVYTPPGYQRTDGRRYPLLVLVPGTPGDERDWTSGGGFAHVMFDNLIAEGRMAPMVVAMHASDVLDPPDGRRGDENMRAFETVIVNELPPAVRQRYNVTSDPALTALAGLSLGGEFGMFTGLNHPEVFRTVATLSASLVPPSFDQRFGTALATAARQKFRLIWLGVGSDDIFFGGNKAFVGRLENAKIPHVFKQYPGAHVMPVFRKELADLLPLLFR